MTMIEREPGASIQELADGVGLARTAANHHVRILAKEGLLSVTRSGRKRLHFPVFVADPLRKAALAALRHRTVAALVEILRNEPRLAWHQAAKRLDLAPQTIRWHISRLEDQGLIEVLRQGRGHKVIVHAELDAVHQRHGSRGEKITSTATPRQQPEGSSSAPYSNSGRFL